ncbi:hypothetical protein TrVE_jg9983 [Triparma verrucosa]|uniref:HECT-type E3 ubiquitin transferase n=1 Tax=Triparma verrucosa TaxID=1606542 RepID=A0A9W7FCA8_9STRA|nr:hypothetical protein TrVE_jg9983 [Triparma verrucosa]
MFDGSYKSKRVISLSGSRNPNKNRSGSRNNRSSNTLQGDTTKAETLRLAREKRKERALNELQKKATTLIQSVYRSHLTRIKILDNVHDSTFHRYISSSRNSLPLPSLPLPPHLISNLPSKTYLYVLKRESDPQVLNEYLSNPPVLTGKETETLTFNLLEPLPNLQKDEEASNLLQAVSKHIPPQPILPTLILAVPNLTSKSQLCSTALHILSLPSLTSLIPSSPVSPTHANVILANLLSINGKLSPQHLPILENLLEEPSYLWELQQEICPVRDPNEAMEISDDDSDSDLDEDEFPSSSSSSSKLPTYPSMAKLKSSLTSSFLSSAPPSPSNLLIKSTDLTPILTSPTLKSTAALNLLLKTYYLTTSPSSFLSNLIFTPSFMNNLNSQPKNYVWHVCTDFWMKSKFDKDVDTGIFEGGIIECKEKVKFLCSKVYFESEGEVLDWLSSVIFLRKVRERWERLQFCEEKVFVWEVQPRRKGGRDEGFDLEAVREGMDEEEGGEKDFTGMFRDAMFGRILETVPFCIDFEVRYDIFRGLILANQKITHDELESIRAMAEGFTPPSYVRIKVGRERLFLDSLEQLNKLGGRMKNKVQVSFVNSEGLDEAGIDGGGVFKEFMGELVRKGFLEEEYFRETENHDLIPNSLPNGGGEAMEFLGRVLGKAVYENILVEPRFGLIFLKKVLGRTNQADDLRFHDAAFFSNLMKLKSPDVDPSDLDLDFTITSSTTLAGQHTETRAQDLVPGGRSIDVTKTNVLGYIFHVAHHMLNVELSAAVKRFLKGFREIIPASWITMFSPRELQKIIGGDDEGGIDVNDLKRTMVYAGGYHESQPIIQWFWEVVEEFSKDEQAKFLMFITSNSRTPLKGFRALTPVPCIQQVYANHAQGGEDDGSERLPTAATCMNLLKLPKYKDKETLKKKLTYAVMSGAGFELS